jgi:hypothetical protein
MRNDGSVVDEPISTVLEEKQTGGKGTSVIEDAVPIHDCSVLFGAGPARESLNVGPLSLDVQGSNNSSHVIEARGSLSVGSADERRVLCVSTASISSQLSTEVSTYVVLYVVDVAAVFAEGCVI